MTTSSFKDIEKAIQAKIDKSLNGKVKETVKEVMIKNIQETVYDSYEPLDYQRRYGNDGLLDPSNIGGYTIDNTLVVFNATLANPYIFIEDDIYKSKNEGDYLTPIIEYGQGYDFHSVKGNRGYEKPRPFIENTREELKQTKAHVKSLKEDLKSQGLNVK